jgi:hypothetical protein
VTNINALVCKACTTALLDGSCPATSVVIAEESSAVVSGRAIKGIMEGRVDSEPSILVILYSSQSVSVSIWQPDGVMKKEIYYVGNHTMVDILYGGASAKRKKIKISRRIQSNRMDQMELSIFPPLFTVCGETLPTDDEQTGDPLGTLQESPGTEREHRLLTRGTSLIRR